MLVCNKLRQTARTLVQTARCHRSKVYGRIMRHDSLISRRFSETNKNKLQKQALDTFITLASCCTYVTCQDRTWATLNMRLIMHLHQLPGLPIAIRSHATQCLVLKSSLSWAASHMATDDCVVFWKGKLSQQPKLAWLNQWLNGIMSGLSGKSWYDQTYGWAEVTWRAAKASQSCAHGSQCVHMNHGCTTQIADCHMQTMYSVSRCRHMTRQITSAPCGCLKAHLFHTA